MTYDEPLAAFLIGLLVTAVLGTLIITGFAMADHHIAYWLAYVIAAVFTFGGIVVFDSDWID